MTAAERRTMTARMAVALLRAFDKTPGFARRLNAYRDAGLDLSEIDSEMDRRAVVASIRHRLDEAKQ